MLRIDEDFRGKSLKDVIDDRKQAPTQDTEKAKRGRRAASRGDQSTQE